jgi:hypothetical protein
MRRPKYTAELLAEAAKNSTSIAGVLRYLGVKWSGGSHHHISKRLRILGVECSVSLSQVPQQDTDLR